MLRSGETSFAYEREVQPRPKLGQWTEELEKRLAANDLLSRRERLGLIRILEGLRVAGYEGGYDAVRRYATVRKRKQGTGSSDAFVPLSFAPGEAYQFDWSHEIVVLRGATTEIKVAQVRLCHSRMLFVRASLADQQDRLGAGHVLALRQRPELSGRDAGAVELEFVQRLHPRQPRLMQQARNRPALTLLHLGRQQRLEVADMALPLADGGIREASELAADRRHAQRLAMLPDRLVLEIGHQALPAQGPDSSTSYSAIVGIGRS